MKPASPDQRIHPGGEVRRPPARQMSEERISEEGVAIEGSKPGLAWPGQISKFVLNGFLG